MTEFFAVAVACGAGAMRLLAVALLLPVCLNTAHSQDRLVIGRDITAFHADAMPLPGGEIEVLEPNKTNDYYMRSIAILMGIKISENPWEVPELPLVVHKVMNINNALAGISISQGTRIPFGMRFVLYDAGWDAPYYWVLAHELGHHACGHADGSEPSNGRTRELEADRYAGSALRRLERLSKGFSFQNEIEDMRKILPVNESRSHPAAKERIDAVILGYKSGSPCTARNIDLYAPQQ